MTFQKFQEIITENISEIKPIKTSGKVVYVKGLIVKCIGISDIVTIGSKCQILNQKDNSKIICEVIGFDQNHTILMPFENPEGIGSESVVEVLERNNLIYPDNSWLGRIIDAYGLPSDNNGILKKGKKAYNLKAQAPAPNLRQKIGNKISLGVKVVDTFTSCCKGQRMGIFAGSGVGKSILISMLSKYAAADVKVIGLIGERSREAKEFIDEYLGKEGLENAVIILATGDESPLLRKRED